MLLPSNNYRPLKFSEGSFIEISTIALYALKAAEIENNPLERIKIITAAIIGGCTTLPRILGGMNVIPVPLGSTAQASLLGKINMYNERIGPLRTDGRTFVIGPDGCFRISSSDKVLFYLIQDRNRNERLQS